MTTQNLYSHHHGRDLTIQHIESALSEAEVEGPDRVTTAASTSQQLELAPSLDGFHSRGIVATQELCDMMSKGIQSTDCILDVGCGLGETSRFLASHYGAKVVGLDVCEEFVSVGRVLTEKEGLQDRVKHIRGNALKMPFPDEAFDAIFMEHMEMSITDKAAFYKEIARVLKPAGRVLFHDIFLGGSAAAPIYPMPWAEREEMSVLVPFDTIRTVAASNGMYVAQSKDVTAITEEFFEEHLPPSSECPTIDKGSFKSTKSCDENSAIKLQNHIHNLSSRRIIVMMVVLKKMGESPRADV